MSFTDFSGTTYESNILPAIPPGAPISSTSSIDANQAGKIPGKFTPRGAVGFTDWPKHQSTAAELETWSSWENWNVSLNCQDRFVGIDLDAEDESFIAACLAAVELFIGSNLPRRARTNSARILLVTVGNVRKRALKFVNEKTGESAGIDILGQGSQFVIEGVHPSGGKYHWPKGELYEYDESDLVVVDELMIDQLINEIITRVSGSGWAAISGADLQGSGVNGQNDNVEYLPAAYEQLDLVDAQNLRFLSVNMRQMIVDGVEVGNRSNALASVIHHLINAGWSDNQIANLLLNPAHGIGDKCRENGIDWTMKDIARIRGKFQGVSTNNSTTTGYSPSSSNEHQTTEQISVDELSEDSLMSQVESLDRGCSTADIEPILERLAKVENKLLKENVINAIKRQTGIAKGVLIETLKSFSGGDDADNGDAQTHNQLARRYLSELIANEIRTVHFGAKLYELGSDMVWAPKSDNQAMLAMSAVLEGESNYTRNGDYKAVYECYARHVEDEEFLLKQPAGIALADGYFYSWKNKQLSVVPLEASHHRTWVSDIAPDEDCKHEHWDAFLDRTFEGRDKKDQIRMLREVISAMLLGRLTHMQYAVLFHGPGATGKTVLLQVLSAMFPSDVVGSVPPHMWSSEYYMATLSGLVLNVIGETPEHKPIEGESFKKFLDRLPITARHPAGRPFQFIPQAATVFNANSYPYLQDKSDAMLRRVLILQFRNIVPEADRDPDFVEKLKSELPYIMWWALTGAVDRIEPSQTCLDSRLEWAGKSNNVLEFLNDENIFVANKHSAIPMTTVFELYKAFCKVSGYKAYGRNNFISLMKEAATVLRTYHRDHHPSGRECLRGFELAPEAIKYTGVIGTDMKPAFSMMSSVG